MKNQIPFEILEPWTELTDSEETLISELKKEMRDDDDLFGSTFVPIAQRKDCDDVLFIIENRKPEVAVIHLTWSGHADPNKGWPSKTIYSDLNDWRERCMILDYEDYHC